MSTTLLPDELAASLIHLKSVKGEMVSISPHGAHVLSWVTGSGEDRLFLSPKSKFGTRSAIRGGVPVIFPQFSDMGPLPKHGFARNQTWNVAHLTESSAVFRLSESEMSLLVWPHRFLLEYTVRISENSLEMSLSVTNTDEASFSFSAALHTYLKINILQKTAVRGLEGTKYQDFANAGCEVDAEFRQVTFPGEVDRLYKNAPAMIVLLDAGRNLNIFSSGFPDAVIWNPGPEKCARLEDMETDGYLRFVCVEAAAAAQPVVIAPGGNWTGTQILSVG